MLNFAFEKYLKIEKGYSPQTVRAYTTDLNNLATFLSTQFDQDLYDPLDINTINTKMLRGWMGSLKSKGLTSRTVSRKLSSVKAYFRFLLQTTQISHDPCTGLKSVGNQKKLPVYLKEQETEHLLDQITFPNSFEGIRDYCILEILYGCGLRRSEIINLQTENIDLLGGNIRIWGKGNKERIVPFGKHVRQAIIKYVAALKLSELDYRHHFFMRSNGAPLYPKLVYRIVNKYLSLASNASQKSPHVLRHTFATHLLDRGADLNAIKELLGHTSLASTQVYTHNTIRKLKAVHQQAHPRSQKKTHN